MKKSALFKIAALVCALLISFTAAAVDFLPVPGSQKGCIAIVNRQDRLAEESLQMVCNEITKATRCRVQVGKDVSGEVVIEIIDDATAPALTVYPEEYRACVNIGVMDKKLKGRALEKFFASRCRKEILRAFCYACGAGVSQYNGNIMTIVNITELDMVDEFIPGDTAFVCCDRLAKLGVFPQRFASYAKAVREGWAPAPTNDAQRAIWDKVQAEKERGPAVQRPIRRQGAPRAPRRAK